MIIAYFQGVCSSGLDLAEKLETPRRHSSDKIPLQRSVINSLPSLKKLWKQRSRNIINADEFAQSIRFQVGTLCQSLIHTAERDIFIANDDGELIGKYFSNSPSSFPCSLYRIAIRIKKLSIFERSIMIVFRGNTG